MPGFASRCFRAQPRAGAGAMLVGSSHAWLRLKAVSVDLPRHHDSLTVVPPPLLGLGALLMHKAGERMPLAPQRFLSLVQLCISFD